jgi:hypothetical protein
MGDPCRDAHSKFPVHLCAAVVNYSLVALRVLRAFVVNLSLRGMGKALEDC